MADFSTLISRIKAAIKPNGAGQITGQVMQDALVKTGEGIVQEINAAKQDTLVSGTNIKTVGGQSLLGAGDISIETDLSYTGTVFHDGDVEMSNVEEITIGGVTYESGFDWLVDHDSCKIGRVISQIDPEITETEDGYPYHDVKRFIIVGIDDADGVVTLKEIGGVPSELSYLAASIPTIMASQVLEDGELPDADEFTISNAPGIISDLIPDVPGTRFLGRINIGNNIATDEGLKEIMLQWNSKVNEPMVAILGLFGQLQYSPSTDSIDQMDLVIIGRGENSGKYYAIFTIY
jgi:hypothetical protein